MSTQIGRWGEELVSTALQKRGHKIVALNWRTRTCEIDVISKHKKTVYFTEVKTRSDQTFGSGLMYISDKKLSQMQYAAERWIYEQKWNGEAMLQAAEVDSKGLVEIIELGA